MDMVNKNEDKDTDGPTEELLKLLDQCDLSTSPCATPNINPATSVVQHSRLRESNSSLQLQYHPRSRYLWFHEALQRESFVSKSKEEQELSVIGASRLLI